MSATGPTSKLPPSYRRARCCHTCLHCLLISHQDYTESYCNRDKDAPPAFNIREFDRRLAEADRRLDAVTPGERELIEEEEDRAYQARIDWERDHDVDEWGDCDLYTPQPLDPRAVILLNPQQMADLEGFADRDPSSSSLLPTTDENPT